MTAPGSVGPRVTDERRAEILRDAKEQPALLHTYSWFELADLLIEGASLRAQLDHITGSDPCPKCGAGARAACYGCENQVLRAQNERLREALERFVKLSDWEHSTLGEDGPDPFYDCAIVAKRALASTDTGETP